ncbi:MAG: D-amino-acid transaminase [Gammaproteobacteria bacterium]|nr:D-amino-acid transaminase [Gammaproteobacteria bacterium]
MNTSSTAYINGQFVPLSEVTISPLDRGFVFGDGVYEVIPVYHGVAFRLDEHLLRLNNSLSAIRLDNPYSDEKWATVLNQLIEENQAGDQSLYIQITRGVAERDHAFPETSAATIFAMSKPLPASQQAPIKAITLQDIRWQWCHIKSTALLGNLLLRQQAIDRGCQEAILLRDGVLTEGAASNVFIVKDGVILTPQKSNQILPGITRDIVVELAEENNVAIAETEISEQQLLSADEIWVTSATKEIAPVIELNGKPINSGKIGPACQVMQKLFNQFKQTLRNQ